MVAEAHGERDGSPQTVRISLRRPSDYGVTAMSAVAIALLLMERPGAAGPVPSPHVVDPHHLLPQARKGRHNLLAMGRHFVMWLL